MVAKGQHLIAKVTPGVARGHHALRYFRVEQVVGNSGWLSVLGDALVRRSVELGAVGRQRVEIGALQAGLANLEAALMGRIIDAEDVDELGVKCRRKS